MSEITIKRLSEQEIVEKGIKSWPIWEKGIATFEWYYDSTEECLILEGEFEVKTKDKSYHLKAGDFVIFPQGLSCVWEITKPVRKHFHFAN